MKKINSYIDSVFQKKDELLDGVLQSIDENGMRPISVSPSSGQLLTMLVAISGAKNILEIGALGGYSGICLARGFEETGHLTSLELMENYAELAKSNLAKAGFDQQVTYMTGPALHSLEQLAILNKRFDFFFIDADKENYGSYLDACIDLAEDGAVIVADNVLAGGTVADSDLQPKQYTKHMAAFNKTVANHTQLESVLVPIGDGMTISRVKKQQ